MEIDFTFLVLEYLAHNTTNFDYIDIVGPFKHLLDTQTERNKFKHVLKELNPTLICIDGHDYLRINSTLPSVETLNAEATGGYDFIRHIGANPRELYPLDKIEAMTKITIDGLEYLKKIYGKFTLRKTTNEEIMFLEDAVMSDDALNKIYTLLSDFNLIDDESKYFKDKLGGGKGQFYSTIIKFYEKGYFKREPSPKEYLNICINSFNVSISAGTAKNHKTRSASTVNVPLYISTTSALLD